MLPATLTLLVRIDRGDADVYADGVLIANTQGTRGDIYYSSYNTTTIKIPAGTRLLAVYAWWGNTGGMALKTSSGFVTSPAWKCNRATPSLGWARVKPSYNDASWPATVARPWPEEWENCDLHPAQLISTTIGDEITPKKDQVFCRGWLGKYAKYTGLKTELIVGVVSPDLGCDDLWLLAETARLSEKRVTQYSLNCFRPNNLYQNVFVQC